MPRHAGVSPTETRERLIAAAVTLMADHGFDGVTTRGISKAAGLTLGAFHHHFETKEDIHTAVSAHADNVMAGLFQTSLATFDPLASFETQVASITRNAWRFARLHRSAIRFRMRQMIDGKQRSGERVGEAPVLQAASMVIAMRTGASPQELQVWLMGVTHLVGRYAIASDEELRVFAPSGDAEQVVEDALVNMMLRMLTPLSR